MEELDLGLVGEGLSPTADTQRQALEAQLELETDPERVAVLEQEIERLSPGQSVLQDIVAALPELSSALASTTGDAPAPIYGPGRQFLVEATRAWRGCQSTFWSTATLRRPCFGQQCPANPTSSRTTGRLPISRQSCATACGEMLPVDEARQEDFATNWRLGRGLCSASTLWAPHASRCGSLVLRPAACRCTRTRARTTRQPGNATGPLSLARASA
jgi:hypothetical protein